MLFKDSDKLSEYLSDYEDEYENILIKETYDINPDITYPCIDIQELLNSDIARYKDENGEFASTLTYQIDISCEQNERFTAQENIRRIAHIISCYFQEDRYKCLDRVGNMPISPSIEDTNVMTGHLRYTCALVLKDNIIYRRY